MKTKRKSAGRRAGFISAALFSAAVAAPAFVPAFPAYALAGAPSVFEDVVLADGVTAVRATEAGGIACTVCVDGFHGIVILDVTVDSEGTVDGMAAVSHEETPALGGAALEGGYLSGYAGLSATEEIDGVDAFSGATCTSDAIKAAAKAALAQYSICCGGEYAPPTALTPDEIRDGFLAGYLGDDYERLDVEPSSVGSSTLTGVYRSGAGYAMDVSGFGHDEDSPVRLLVCLEPGGAVSEINVIEHHETVGFGANALQESYLNLYKGGSMFTNVAFGPGTYIAPCPGASETSAAVLYMVNLCTIQYSLLNPSAAGLPGMMFP